MAQKVNNLPAMEETRVRSLDWEDPLEKGMATHAHILAWRIPGTEEPDRLQSMGSQRVRHDWAANTFTLLGPDGSDVKESACNAGDLRDTGLIPRLERSPGGVHSKPLQYSYLQNPMDRGGWWATVHTVAESNMKRLSMDALSFSLAGASNHVHYSFPEIPRWIGLCLPQG